MSSLKEKLKNDGYAVVPSVLTPDEVSRARSQCVEHLHDNGFYFMRGKTDVHVAAKIPALDWLFSHPKIIAAAREGIGEDVIAFTGHCDVFVNSDVAGWHKDDGRGKYLFGDYFQAANCKIYKVGVYLQDHSTIGGLTVRHGSHRIPGLTAGDERYCSTRPGDIVIFDIRITHRGRFSQGLEALLFGGVELVLPRKASQGFIHYTRLAANRFTGADDRVSLFFTFGAKNEFTRHFAEQNMKRQLVDLGSTGIPMPETLVRELNRQRVAVYACDF